MIYLNIDEVILRPEYNFLNTDKFLKSNIMFLTFGGSYAYGTNTLNSDIDIRGCVLNRKSDLIGLTEFEQFMDKNTDTTIYSFNKFINLLINCNPNVIELLGCKSEHYTKMSEDGRMLLENKKIFLSQKAINSFSGYATDQLRRLQNSLARDCYTEIEKENHIMNSVKSAILDFNNRYTKFDDSSIVLSIDKAENKDLDFEIFANVNLKHYPLRDYKNIWSEMNNIVKDYGKLNKRNRKKDNQHLNKHAMHLIRLYLMCLDILEKEQINTYRENDLELLMSIRNGEFQNRDGSYSQSFFDLVSDLENRVEYAKRNTNLPLQPNYNKIEELVIEINRKVVLFSDL